MKGLNKRVLIPVLTCVPLLSNAELSEIDDKTMADVSGQSGLILEVNAGSAALSAGAAGDTSLGADVSTDYSNAGLTIESQKWIVDVETYDSTTNIHDPSTSAGTTGGMITQNISVAGTADITIDAVEDLSVPTGGLAVRFANTDLNIKVGNSAFFSNNTLSESMGGTELNGINVDGVQLVLRGSGLANP